ncbi:MAG: GntR family transcriptional regulator [Planctomycetaceae bacterium]|nr:MAG: GntR family transcriptional regulator [Planctomycetaceae bacterium]
MDTQLVHSPVYQQLNQRLRSALAAEYRLGDQFLTEREIAEKFHVSRATANKSLASLVSEGFLEFRKGVGTFVRRGVIDYDVRSLVSFTEKARAAGKKPSTELLTFGKLTANEADESVRTALSVECDSLVWEMERVRLADDVPVILEHRYVVHRHCPKLTKSQAEGSLYRAWTGPHGLKIAGANEVIRAVLLTTEESQRLQTIASSPALEVVSVGFLEDDSPLWWERTLYRGDQYEFHSRLGPIQSATPARGKLR